MKAAFKSANDDAKAVMDLNAISYTEDADGIEIEFPENVQISDDRDEFSQPSYYQYDVPTAHGTERFVYQIDSQTLVVE